MLVTHAYCKVFLPNYNLAQKKKQFTPKKLLLFVVGCSRKCKTIVLTFDTLRTFRHNSPPFLISTSFSEPF